MQRDGCTRRFVKEYLTGQLSTPAREHFEDEYLRDDGVYEELIAIEEELIDEFLHEDASPKALRSVFLADPGRLERVRFAMALDQLILGQAEKEKMPQAVGSSARPLSAPCQRSSFLERVVGLFRRRERTPAVEASLRSPSLPNSAELQSLMTNSGLVDLRDGVLLFANDAGLAYVADVASGEQYAFTFERIRHYRGQTVRDLGMRSGTPVQFRVQDGNVNSVDLITAGN